MTRPRTNLVANRKGIVTLATAIVVFLVSLSIAISVQFLGLGELQHGFAGNLGEQAFAIADGCVDEALQRLRMSDSYTGGTLSIGDDSCTITVSGSGGTRQINVTSTVETNYVRKIRVDITITSDSPRNNVTVTSWQELTS